MKFPLLLDIYGVLLGDRKREILEYYYDEDYSLAEISEITGISRQGVRDSIKKSEEEIYSLEEKLGIAKKNRQIGEILDLIEEKLSVSGTDTDGIGEALDKLRTLIRSGEGSQD